MKLKVLPFDDTRLDSGARFGRRES